LELPNEYRYTSTAGVFGDRWASLIQPALAAAGAADATAAGTPSSSADEAINMAIRLVIPGNLMFLKSLP
jgi:hypothetical protein